MAVGNDTIPGHSWSKDPTGSPGAEELSGSGKGVLEGFLDLETLKPGLEGYIDLHSEEERAPGRRDRSVCEDTAIRHRRGIVCDSK